METGSNTTVTPPDAKRMLVACGFSIGQKVQVFDGQKWEHQALEYGLVLHLDLS